MTQILDLSQTQSVLDLVLEAFDGSGYTVEELVPGLVQAIIELADGDDDVLDAAANLLADGGVHDEDDFENIN